MTAAELLYYYAGRVGREAQAAHVLHSCLCVSPDPAARFAAALVLQAIEHYAAGDNLLRQLAALAGEKP